MVTILAAKPLTKNPADGIDNFTRAVFGRMRGNDVCFYTEMEGISAETGALRRLSVSRMDFLRRERPDFLWGIGRASELPLLFARSRKTKYLINFHTLLYKKSVGAWSVRTPWFVRKFIFNQADMIICPSEFSAESVRRYFPKKRVVSILNGVDIDLFHPEKKNPKLLEEKYGIRTDKPIIAFVGALQARKRPGIFIEIARRFPDAHFVAVGRKVPESDFITGAETMKNFQWVPAMPREDVAALLAVSSAFVFPSLDEPAAAVILEAMASGCVPILSKSGGNGEFFKDGESGFLVPADENEIDGFLGVLRKLFSDEGFFKSVFVATRREAERHSFNAVADQYKNTIFSLCGSH